MKKYNVDVAFWHRGRLVAAGETVPLTAAEAKYLGHVVSEPATPAAAPEPAPAPEHAPATVVEEPAPTLVVAVAEEKPARHGKRNKRHAGADHDDDQH
jgi:hypothetical protein